MAASGILYFLVASLMITSGLTSAIILDKEHQEFKQFNPYIDLPLLVDEQDFTNNGGFNLSVLSGAPTGAGWNFNDGIGLISLRGSWVLPNAINLKNVHSDNGDYDIIYTLNNSVTQDFRVLVRDTRGLIGYNIYLDFTSEGIRYPNGILPVLTNYNYEYPDVNKIEDLTIRTVLHENVNTLSVYVNEQFLFTCAVNNNAGNVLATYYAGIAATGEGLTIVKIHAPVILNQTDIISQIMNFMGVFASLILWNVSDKYLPALANLIMIKTQLTGIFIAIVVIARGGA